MVKPLSELMNSVSSMGGPGRPERVAVRRTTGEVGELATAFNEMVDRLDGKRRSLVRETEERIALERRLRGAEKFAAIGRLTSGLAHELGSPMGVIAMRAEAIANDGGAPEIARTQGRAILNEIDRMTGLVRDLEHVARRYPVAREPLDLGDVVAAVAAGVHEDAEGSGIRVEVAAPEEPVLVSGDGVLLRHGLSNLATNSVQALARRDEAADGGWESGWIRIGLREDAGKAVVRVEDNGPGIDSDDFSRLVRS